MTRTTTGEGRSNTTTTTVGISNIIFFASSSSRAFYCSVFYMEHKVAQLDPRCMFYYLIVIVLVCHIK